MAANYKVNIELDTKKLDKQLRRLKTQVEEVGKIKRVGGGGSKGGIIANDADDKFLRTAGIRLRKLATAQNALINKADKIASKGGMLALPDSKMLNAQVKGIKRLETSSDIVAKQTERKAKAEQRSAEYAKDAMKANQASAKAGAAHAKKLERMRKDTGFTAAQYGPQFDSMSLPTESALNFDRRTGRLLRGPAGSNRNTLRNLGRRFDTQSALISGAFPLLFGQGPIGALAGGLGGGIGGMFGQMGGFAGGIAATAAVQVISNAINGVRAFGEGLKNVETSLATVTEKSLFSSDATQKRAEQLKKLGKQQELNKLLTQELTIALGGKGLERLKQVGKSSRELARTFGQLGASIQAVLAKAILPGINAINTILSGFTIPSQFKNFKESLSGADLTRFNEIVLEERGTRKERGRTKKGLLTPAVQKRALSRAVGEGLGGDLSLLGGTTDPSIEANLNKRIAFLQRSLEIGKEQATIEQKIVEFKDKGTDLTEEEIGKKLRLINNLQKTEQLYQQIGSSIENGIVDALEGAIQGTRTLGDVARSVFTQIQRSLISYGVDSLLSSLPGKLGKAFSEKRANGGPVTGGSSYLVGERGPELFTPGRSGMITSNENLGSTTVIVNVDASGSSVEGDQQGANVFGEQIAAAVQAVIINEKRVGGLLS